MAGARRGPREEGGDRGGGVGVVGGGRGGGWTVPFVLMGSLTPLLAYGREAFARDGGGAGVDGFIVVDLLPEDSSVFTGHCKANGLAFVPLVAPTTPTDRLAMVTSVATAFTYCVSVTGVTGARTELPPDLADFLARVRAHTKIPLAVGFGLSTAAHVKSVGALAEGVVMGSAIVRALEEGGVEALETLLKEGVPSRS